MVFIENKITHGLAKVTNRFRGEVSISRRRGARWALAKSNYIDFNLLTFRYYEKEQIGFCEQFLANNPVQVFFDIGANFGLYSIHFATHTKIPKVYAFEPVKRNHMQLCANIFLNGLQDVIDPYQVALSDSAGERAMQVDKKSTGLSRLGEIGTGDRFYSETVNVCVFDNLFAHRGVNAFVKCDTEGHELEVFRGMREFLAGNKVFLQVEAFNGAAADYLQALGYKQIGQIASDCYFTNS